MIIFPSRNQERITIVPFIATHIIMDTHAMISVQNVKIIIIIL